LDKQTNFRNWISATISAREDQSKKFPEVKQKVRRGKAKKRQESPRDQPSHSLSSAIDQLGQLTLQGEPSPTDAVPVTAGAPPRAPQNLAATSQSPAPQDHAGPSRKASVGRPFLSPKFYVEMTRRKVPKVAASSGKQPRRHRQISPSPSPSRSPEHASPHIELSDARNESTNAARIAALEQRFASFEATQAARQAELDQWTADVDVWMADIDDWRR
jgi:hypothetical protein